MTSGFVILLVLGIGFVAGLRTMTAPAVVAWAAHLGWIHLSATPLAFMASVWAVGFFTVGALAEYFIDQLPSTPPRTGARGLIPRAITSFLSGACLALAGGLSPWLGAVIAVVGAMAGAFGGYKARTGLVRALRVPDIVIAIPEDLIAIGLGLLIVTRF
jgi:uncharacterized membrane protein